MFPSIRLLSPTFKTSGDALDGRPLHPSAFHPTSFQSQRHTCRFEQRNSDVSNISLRIGQNLGDVIYPMECILRKQSGMFEKMPSRDDIYVFGPRRERAYMAVTTCPLSGGCRESNVLLLVRPSWSQLIEQSRQSTYICLFMFGVVGESMVAVGVFTPRRLSTVEEWEREVEEVREAFAHCYTSLTKTNHSRTSRSLNFGS